MPPYQRGYPISTDSTMKDFVCCSCGRKDSTVRNMLMLPFRGSVPGTGWGCVLCALPPDGASAILCDACLSAGKQPIRVIKGYLAKNQYEPLPVDRSIFDHDQSKHPATDF
jgi:hypothetical protein